MTTSGQAVTRLAAVGDPASLDPACLLPLAIGVDDADTPGDMLDALALAPFATGRLPYARTARLGEVRPGISLLPPGAANYPAAAAAALDTLMAVTPDTVRGHLVLLHGATGTGKTTVLRTLAREWRAWCQADCVLDPEILFGDPGYLMDAVIGHGSGDEDTPAWRLLLLEDCDDLIGGAAGQPAGQPLSRLLNLTDGMLGQGRQVLVGITTNEDLRQLHPAVIRPGRCLAHIEIGPLAPAEASALLGGPVAGPVTLAELYAMRSGHAAVPLPETGTGLYL